MSMPTLTSTSPSRHTVSNSVAVVIVNYRSADQTIACVRSLESLTGARPRVIVVDNHSGDGSAEILERTLPNVEVIASRENGGYTAGNNLGIESALAQGAEFVLVLNPDTVVINPDFLRQLTQFLTDHPRVGAVGPRVYLRARNRVQNTVLVFPWLHRRFAGVLSRLFPTRRRPIRSGAVPRPAEVLNGVCVLFRSQALRDIGLFDERTFAYIEDVDWAYRADQLGWQRWYLPVDAILHEQKETGYERCSTVEYLLKRNTLYFLLKTRHPVQAIVYSISTLALGAWSAISNGNKGYRWWTKLARSYARLWLGRWDDAMGDVGIRS